MLDHKLAPANGNRALTEMPSDKDSLVPTMRILCELAALAPNWDSYDANPLTAEAVATASTLITAVDESRQNLTGRHAPPWMVAPVPDGGVQVEWMAAPRKIEVLIDPDGSLSYLVIDRSGLVPTYTEEHDVSLEQVRALVDSVLTD